MNLDAVALHVNGGAAGEAERSGALALKAEQLLHALPGRVVRRVCVHAAPRRRRRRHAQQAHSRQFREAKSAQTSELAAQADRVALARFAQARRQPLRRVLPVRRVQHNSRLRHKELLVHESATEKAVVALLRAVGRAVLLRVLRGRRRALGAAAAKPENNAADACVSGAISRWAPPRQP
jgi:hypothetical protein